jgi:hypothetical protein
MYPRNTHPALAYRLAAWYYMGSNESNLAIRSSPHRTTVLWNYMRPHYTVIMQHSGAFSMKFRQRALLACCSYRLSLKSTTRNTVPLEKLTVVQLVKIFPTFRRTLNFITISTTWLPSASTMQSASSHPTYIRPIILIYFSHLYLGLSNNFFPSDLPTATFLHLLTSPCVQRNPPTSSSSIWWT